MKLNTQLLSGAGNTFHIAYGKLREFSNAADVREAMRQVAKTICAKNPADGFIFLDSTEGLGSPQDANEFDWNFFNNDGSDAEMCGNATRCIGYFLVNEIGSRHSRWFLNTVRGRLEIQKIAADIFSVKMPSIFKNESALGFYCDTGVPHLVLPSPFADLFFHLSDIDFLKQSAALRNHESFHGKGTNVTYIQFTDRNNFVRAASFERGVEGFTRACGTGAVAAAFYNLAKRGIAETAVEMPGGTLTINIQNTSEPVMTGPAILLEKHSYEIKI